MDTPQGTVTYPLTPHTIPELLEQMVLVAQEQQGLPVGLDAGETVPGGQSDGSGTEDPDEDEGQLKGGKVSRMTGWAVVNDLWEREDPTIRIAMGAVVVVLLLVGVFIA